MWSMTYVWASVTRHSSNDPALKLQLQHRELSMLPEWLAMICAGPQPSTAKPGSQS
ncbi:hypothetical protein DPMN_076431 [Dreissena polymorpha]|uniref:Uncharacterized protein n=1 Tax=Dreissena polymorpha TaxID=45954 RepID=A0A9D3YNN1_DREPO|nr:hypothetical protein DPMN_076431 [Dreissena polymorpha]